MSRARYTAILVMMLAVTVVGGPIGVANASPATGPVADIDRVEPQNICEGLDFDGSAVTAVTPALPDTPLVGSQTYYGGMNLTVVFCTVNGEAAQTGAWNLAANPGIGEVTRHNQAYVVQLAERNTTIMFAEQVEQKDPDQGFTVDVTVGAVVNSQLSGVDQVALRSASAADDYRTAERNFLSAAEAVRANVSNLNDSAARLPEQGVTAGNPTETLESFATVRSDLQRATTRTERVVYRAAFVGPADTDALDAVNDIHRDINGSVDAALEAYGHALKTRASLHRSAIKNTMLLGLVPGLVVGLLAGVLIPYRRKRKINYDRKFTKTSSESRVFQIPALLAVVTLVVGILVLWLSVPIMLVIP